MLNYNPLFQSRGVTKFMGKIGYVQNVIMLTSNTRLARPQQAVKGIGVIYMVANTLLSRKRMATVLMYARRRFKSIWMA